MAARTAELLDAAPADAVVVQDVPLLVENGLQAAFDLVVVVDAPEDLRVGRLVSARGMDEQDVRARVRSQASRADRLAVADVVLDNAADRSTPCTPRSTGSGCAWSAAATRARRRRTSWSWGSGRAAGRSARDASRTAPGRSPGWSTRSGAPSTWTSRTTPRSR